jgi:hypothetical protein
MEGPSDRKPGRLLNQDEQRSTLIDALLRNDATFQQVEQAAGQAAAQLCG